VETYDYVIMATHADQSLNMVTDLNELERESLSAFPYQKNQVTLHTDTNIMPETHMAWASWNYRIKKSGERKATLTYNMTMLQKLNTPHTYLVSLNSDDDIDESKVIRRFSYEHPVFQAQLYQSRDHLKSHAFDNLIGFGGAWMGNGFHEDGVSSALNLCKKLNEVLNV
jgi:predicted NAD/FAD-binding protein